MKPTVFNYQEYERVVEENKKLNAEVADLRIRCRIADGDKRDCKSCRHQKPDGCSRWDCEYEPAKSDLISRPDAIEAVQKVWCNNDDQKDFKQRYYEMGNNDAVEDAIGYIDALPSADAVEVVRCKDCRNANECHKSVHYTRNEPNTVTIGYLPIERRVKMTKGEVVGFLEKCRWWFEPFTSEKEQWNEALDMAIEALADRPTGWIPVSERLPSEPFGCIVTVWDGTHTGEGDDFENILPYFVGWDGEIWNDGDGEQCPFEVIAWMPVPEPYIGGESDG